MAIFSLKQLGWKDRQEIDNNVNLKADKSILEIIAKSLNNKDEV